MVSKVAIVELHDNVQLSFKRALELIGKIDDLNTATRSVVVKVGIFHHRAENHASVSVVNAIVNSFNKAPKIFLAESDNYIGNGSERLQIYKELFTERVIPFNLSEDTDTKKVNLANQKMDLSHILFKPNVFVSTHILRSFNKGSILKNLFGCTPTVKKAKFHKDEIFYPLLADIFEATGGIDLAVMDGVYLYRGAGADPHATAEKSRSRIKANILLVGRDAVAVETVGATLAGLKPEKMQVIQEFAKRGLGEGDLKNIEVVGASFENLKGRLVSIARELEKNWRAGGRAPKIWSSAIDSLIQEGFFKLPNRRTRDDIKKALQAKSIQTEGKASMIATTLTRKAKKGVLKASESSNGWVYWAE